MIFWIFASLLTVAMIWLLLQPMLGQRRSAGIQPTDVYRAQLQELEREVSTGLVSKEDATSARNEIARRLLRAEENEDRPTDKLAPVINPKIVTIVLMVFVGAMTLGGYLWLGQPGMPAQPYAARDLTAESLTRVTTAAQELERQLEQIEDPADRALYLANALASLGAFDEALEAYFNVLALRPDDADALTRIGELQLAQADGVVNADIAIWFDQALMSRPFMPRPSYYRALYDYQQGRFEAAETRLEALLATAPEGASWILTVSGLRDEARAAQSQLSDEAREVLTLEAEERSTRIREMVAGLAARLEQSPDDFEGWLRLANAYAVLDQPGDAENALLRAADLAAGEAVLEARVAEVAATIGISLQPVQEN